MVIDFDVLPAKITGSDRPLFTGRTEGKAAREFLGLDKIDLSGEIIEVKIPSRVFAITSSYFLGLFADSIRACGSREIFLQQFKFTCDERWWRDTISPCIERALFEGTLKADPVPGPWEQMGTALGRTLQNFFARYQFWKKAAALFVALVLLHFLFVLVPNLWDLAILAIILIVMFGDDFEKPKATKKS